MMGERTVAQEALFYEFSLSGMSRLATCGAPSTASLICPAFVRIYAPTTATPAGPRSIPN